MDSDLNNNKKESNIYQSLRNTFVLESESIKQISENCNYDALVLIISEFANCTGKVVLSGCGTSGEACKKIAHTLSCVGCGAFFISPSEGLHGGLGVLRSNDIVVLISKGGKTLELDEMVPIIKSKGCKIISVTENENSNIALNSNIFLKLPIVKEAGIFNVLATSSTISIISIFDAIAIEIGNINNFNLDNFALIHPGGAVGLSLLNDRKD